MARLAVERIIVVNRKLKFAALHRHVLRQASDHFCIGVAGLCQFLAAAKSLG